MATIKELNATLAAEDEENKKLVPDELLHSAMKAWARSDAFLFTGMSEQWKAALRRALAVVVRHMER